MAQKHILIIEDEVSLQEILRDELERQGFRVSSALEGDTAMEVVHQTPPDLILLDLLMPHVDGMTFLATLRKNKKMKDIPVIILTNVNEMGEVSRAVEYNVYDYLVKSDVTVPQLVDRIRTKLSMPDAEHKKTPEKK
jgi:DNA-binding response OmpR family regulator